MAYKHVVNPEQLQCLSSDTHIQASEGSTLHVVDTGEELVFHDGDWVPDLRRARAIKTADTLEIQM